MIIQLVNIANGASIQGSAHLKAAEDISRMTLLDRRQFLLAGLSATGLLEACGSGYQKIAGGTPLNHVLVTGQSLATANYGCPALSLFDVHGNVMFNVGARLIPDGGANLPVADSSLASFVPLAEANAGNNTWGETICSGFASRVAARAPLQLGGTHRLLMAVNGLSGTAYVGLKRGTTAYENGLHGVSAAVTLSESYAFTSYQVRSVIAVHGEADEGLETINYADDLAEWQRNYNQDIKALVGQVRDVPLQICQMSSGWAASGGVHNLIPQQQLDAAEANPGVILLACPKYMLPYNLGDLHLTNAGYRWLGEYHSKTYEAVQQGKIWRPLSPRSITTNPADATQLIVDFWVPEPPLVFDVKRVSEPTSISGQRYGFEVFNPNGAARSITSIAPYGSNGTTLLLQMDAALSAGARLRYAYSRPTQNGHLGVAGPTGDFAGNRGNLRDSDSTPSLYNNDLFNWCVIFDKAIS